jgi:hypothetical protein
MFLEFYTFFRAPSVSGTVRLFALAIVLVYKYRNSLGPSLETILGIPNAIRFHTKGGQEGKQKINALYLSKISGRPRGGEARGQIS